MFQCQDFQATLYEFVAGELLPEQRQEAEKHLLGCEACATNLQEYRQTIEAGWTLPQVPPPPRLLERFREALAEQEAMDEPRPANGDS